MGVPVPAKPVGNPIPLLKPMFNHRGYCTLGNHTRNFKALLLGLPHERLPKPRWFVFYSVFPFAISFANLSRCGVFLSQHPCVWNTLSRTFAENPEKNPLCSLANAYWNICSPHAMWESLDFIRAARRPSPLPPPSPPRLPPSTASSRSQWALPEPLASWCEPRNRTFQPLNTSIGSIAWGPWLQVWLEVGLLHVENSPQLQLYVDLKKKKRWYSW